MPYKKIEKLDIIIDADLLSKFEDLPEFRGVFFTAQMDTLILKYWPIKQHQDVARLLKISVGTAMKRYKDLTNGKTEVQDCEK